MSKGEQSVTAGRSAEELEQLILSTVAKQDCIADTWDFATEQHIDHQVLVGVLKSLLVDLYVVDEPLSLTYWSLTAEGKDVVQNGSPEMQVFRAVPPDTGVTVSALQSSLGDVAKVGMGVCMKNKWLMKKGELIVRNPSTPADLSDETAALLAIVDSNSSLTTAQDTELKNLKKRKLVQQVTRKSFKVGWVQIRALTGIVYYLYVYVVCFNCIFE